MPNELFKDLPNKTALMNSIYELLSEYTNTGHGKINCLVALQSDKEVFAYSNVKNQKAVVMLNDLINTYTPSSTATLTTTDYYE